MAKFQCIVIVMVILIGLMSGLGSCGRLKLRRGGRNLTDAQCLLRVSRKYFLVENFLLSTNDTRNRNRPVPFGTGEGTKNCPWIWRIDDEPNRIPRFLARAECSKCNFNCRAVFYSHSTLEQRCTHKSPVCLWWRIERPMEVAYVFDLD